MMCAMQRSPKPRRHHHLSREAIARAALDLVDREGAEALSLRAVATALQVQPMNLYSYVQGRDGMVRDVIALLLSEVDVSERPGVTWEECCVEIGLSLRDMALRHPHAFPFVAVAPNDEWPVTDNASRVHDLMVAKGAPEEILDHLFRMLDAYSMGALLWEAHVATRPAPDSLAPFAAQPPAQARPSADEDPAIEFVDDTRTIIAGVKVWYGIA
jgi:AcrR family transcriptional regulator